MKSVIINAIVGTLCLGIILALVVVMNTVGMSYEMIAFPILMLLAWAFGGFVLSYIMEDEYLD